MSFERNETTSSHSAIAHPFGCTKVCSCVHPGRNLTSVGKGHDFAYWSTYGPTLPPHAFFNTIGRIYTNCYTGYALGSGFPDLGFLSPTLILPVLDQFYHPTTWRRSDHSSGQRNLLSKRELQQKHPANNFNFPTKEDLPSWCLLFLNN